jgi:putative ABC transport system permease protein
LISALMLAVGGIGIMNVLLAAVAERTREIGIRKAVGASARDIHAQFLVESITVTGAGSAIGFVVGLLIAAAGTAVFRVFAHAPIYPVVQPLTALLAVASAVIGRSRVRDLSRAARVTIVAGGRDIPRMSKTDRNGSETV